MIRAAAKNYDDVACRRPESRGLSGRARRTRRHRGGCARTTPDAELSAPTTRVRAKGLCPLPPMTPRDLELFASELKNDAPDSSAFFRRTLIQALR